MKNGPHGRSALPIDNGVNYIDTAFPYHGGESERFLGRALQDGYREKVKLATKLPHSPVQTRGDMDRILTTQLEKLRTDHIDYYLLHELDAERWTKLFSLGVLEFLDTAKAAGKIRNAGFSFHGTVRRSRRSSMPMTGSSARSSTISLMRHTRPALRALYAAAKNIAVMIMEPLRGGKLARNLRRKQSRSTSVQE